MKYLSLFSGIGGFELGIQQAYVDATTRKTNRKGQTDPQTHDAGRQGLVATSRKTARAEGGLTGKHRHIQQELRQPACVGYSEIDQPAIACYQKHFNHTNYGDITKIDEKKLPDFDLLVGGFPCQTFSIAGKRRGFDDTRGTLFFDIARILRSKQPRLLLLENVKGLLSHDDGYTFRTIIATLDELGYDLQWQVLNSKNFGVPQNRERVYIVGHLRGSPRPEVFPITQSNSQHLREITSGVSDAQRIYEITGLAKTLKGLGGGMGAKTGLYATPKIRRLTPVECERLMGFPKSWTAGASDTQRYKMTGNAVTVNVVRAIVKKLL